MAAESWADCVGGTVTAGCFLQILAEIGFVRVEIIPSCILMFLSFVSWLAACLMLICCLFNRGAQPIHSGGYAFAVTENGSACHHD